MLMQLNVLGEYKNPVPRYAEVAIEKGLHLLSRHQYADLAKLLEITISEAENIAHYISTNLNPYPARAHWGDAKDKNINDPQSYQKPDIIIKQLNTNGFSSLVVEILLPLRGTLQINSLFQQTLKKITNESAEKWKKDLESANLFIKCIQQRNNTMQRLMKYIAKTQRSFILKGEKYLKPVTRAEVADKLELHESTISRAVAGKSAQLPSGKIIPLSMFFDRSLPIRAQLKDIIDSEDRPYTDSQLAVLLSKKGYKIARRTVAKYRAMEGILPAHMRKNLKKTKHRKWSTYSLSKQEAQIV
jgi:RNA polymerase sigma-54 factor